tara:strand:- start:683 stop:1585 length:903 start_codon:yes stop_codon:yes gene_type:complete
MATINLGNIKFKWQGAYNGATSYTLDDVVSYNGSSYICIQASTGNLPTDTAYWEQMSQAGTNGTDLSTTLTTQGDILYRDGSGLQRLGAGTSGQVLLTNGTGANPSWGTLSSDFVKIAEHDFATTNATGVTFDNVFDGNTYSHYVIYGDGLNAGGSNITNPLQGVLRSGGASGTDVTSNYAYVTIGAYREWNAVWSDNTAGYNQSVSYIKVADWGGGHTSSPNGMGGTINFQMNIGGVHNSANHVNFYSLEYDGLSSAIPYLANVTHHSTHYGTGTHTGIRLFNNGSNYVRGTIKIYGLK